MWRTLRFINTHTKDIPQQTEAEKAYSDAKDTRYTFLLSVAVYTVWWLYTHFVSDRTPEIAEHTFAWVFMLGCYLRAKIYELQAGQFVQVEALKVLLQLAEQEKLGTPTT
jgi:hypothetical protein